MVRLTMTSKNTIFERGGRRRGGGGGEEEKERTGRGGGGGGGEEEEERTGGDGGVGEVHKVMHLCLEMSVSFFSDFMSMKSESGVGDSPQSGNVPVSLGADDFEIFVFFVADQVLEK